MKPKSKLRVSLLQLALSFNVFASTQLPHQNGCLQYFFRFRTAERAAIIREDIKQASLRFAQSHPEAFSLLRGQEIQLIHLFTYGHAIYLASGADVFRPLYDYPLIQNYHLVDALAGWGSSPQHLIDQIQIRLKDLHETSRVEILDLGFLNVIPSSTLNESWRGEKAHQFIDSALSLPGAEKPLILSVKWNNQVLGIQRKRIFLHAIDFHDLKAMNNVVSGYIFNETASNSKNRQHKSDRNLVGIIEAGWSGFPQSEVFNMLMTRLDKKGHFVFEAMTQLETNIDLEIKQLKTALENNSLNVDVTIPDPKTRLEMARTDFLGKNRFYFEFLISRQDAASLK